MSHFAIIETEGEGNRNRLFGYFSVEFHAEHDAANRNFSS